MQEYNVSEILMKMMFFHFCFLRCLPLDLYFNTRERNPVSQLSSKNMLISQKNCVFLCAFKSSSFYKISQNMQICRYLFSSENYSKMGSAQFFNYFVIPDRLEAAPTDKPHGQQQHVPNSFSTPAIQYSLGNKTVLDQIFKNLFLVGFFFFSQIAFAKKHFNFLFF